MKNLEYKVEQVVTPEKVYGKDWELLVPNKFEVIDFRIPRIGDVIITYGGNIKIVSPETKNFWVTRPTLIVNRKNLPNRRWIYEECSQEDAKISDNLSPGSFLQYFVRLESGQILKSTLHSLITQGLKFSFVRQISRKKL